MASRKDTGEVTELERPEAVGAGADRPKLFVPLGRGGRGKTVLTRWIAEKAGYEGRHPAIADGDRTNQTLAAYFQAVTSPPNTNDLDVRDWMEGLVSAQIEQRITVLLDLGGGDLTLKRLAAELDLVPFLSGSGIDVVAAHLIGPDLDDLAYLQSLEDQGTFAPERTMLVLNEGLVSGNRSERIAFEPITNHEVFRAVVTRGAKVVRMPRLGCLHEVELRRVLFADAAAGKTGRDLPPLNPVNRQRVTMWLREMATAFAPVEDWLP
jgi:hypothetical protein